MATQYVPTSFTLKYTASEDNRAEHWQIGFETLSLKGLSHGSTVGKV